MNSAAQVQLSQGNYETQYSGRRSASNSSDSDVHLSSTESFDQPMRMRNVRKAQPVHRPARVRRRAVDAGHVGQPGRRAARALQRRAVDGRDSF